MVARLVHDQEAGGSNPPPAIPEWPVKVKLDKPRNSHRPVLGGPFSLVLSGTSLSLRVKRQPAYAYFVLSPHMGGHNAWLLVTTQPDKEDILVAEPAGTKLIYFGEPVTIATWFDKKTLRLKTLRVDFPNRTMKLLHETLGDPEGRDRWLYGRLLPRLAGGALRTINSDLQVWIRL